MTKVKICGITNLSDALEAVECGADALGFIFYPASPRSVDREAARAIIRELPLFVSTVGVFVDEDEEVVRDTVSYCGLTHVQFHGSESAEYCSRFRNVIKAFRVKDESSLRCVTEYEGHVDAILLDTYREGNAGGTGESFDPGLLEGFSSRRPVIISGGVNETNAQFIVSLLKPYAVDAASGTESSPGRKDYVRMRRLVGLLKGGDL